MNISVKIEKIDATIRKYQVQQIQLIHFTIYLTVGEISKNS